jgi:hypothetical protein
MPLNPSDGAKAYVKDFKKSKAPQFKGKSDKKKQQMAIAAYLDDKDDQKESTMQTFKTHMMYDPKTGKGYEAKTKLDHLRMKKMGYSHDKPEPVEEAKSGTGYELYHKDFSSAMQHAYKHAKDKLKIEIDPEEIDKKVASGPRKPSSGKTNSYRLTDKSGKKGVQIQVANLDNKRYELNMYKESLDEGTLYESKSLKTLVSMGMLSKPNMAKAERAMRQLKDPDGKALVSLVDGLVKVLSGGEMKEAVELDEASNTISKVKEIVSKKQAMKIDGVMVDMFTASAISQIYDKVNDANKKKMDGLKVTKLADLAMKMMKRESTLDEASKEGTIKIYKTKDNRFQVQRMTKGKFVNQGKPYKSVKDAEKMRSSGQHSMQFSHVEEASLNELTAAEKKLVNQMYDKKGNLTPMGKKVMDHGKAASKLTPKDAAADNARRKEYNAYQKSKRNEEVELDEAPRRKRAPKMTGDSVAIQRAKDAELNKALGRTKTGRKKPVRTMTSTQRSLASMQKEDLDEAFSPKEIKMAIGMAADPRFGNNMTGAVKAIEKLKKGLSSHKQVAAVLKRKNENTADILRSFIEYK